jgi:hypothetical protein
VVVNRLPWASLEDAPSTMRTSSLVPAGTETAPGAAAAGAGAEAAAAAVAGAGATTGEAGAAWPPVKVKAVAWLVSKTCVPPPVSKRIVPAVPPRNFPVRTFPSLSSSTSAEAAAAQPRRPDARHNVMDCFISWIRECVGLCCGAVGKARFVAGLSRAVRAGLGERRFRCQSPPLPGVSRLLPENGPPPPGPAPRVRQKPAGGRMQTCQFLAKPRRALRRRNLGHAQQQMARPAPPHLRPPSPVGWQRDAVRVQLPSRGLTIPAIGITGPWPHRSLWPSRDRTPLRSRRATRRLAPGSSGDRSPIRPEPAPPPLRGRGQEIDLELHPMGCLLACHCASPLPTADCRLPTADCRLPTADCRLPTADCRLPTADCRLPTDPLTTDHRSPIPPRPPLEPGPATTLSGDRRNASAACRFVG